MADPNAAAADEPPSDVFVGVEQAGAAAEALRRAREVAWPRFRPRVHMLDPDPDADPQAPGLDRSSLVLHRGPDAITSFVRHLVENLEGQLPSRIRGGRRLPGLHQAAVAACRQVKGLQTTKAEEARNLLETRDAARGPRHWAERYAGLRAGRGEPWRVMILTSRFTSVLHEASLDLAAAVRARGGRAEVVAEPTRHALLVPLGSLRAAVRLDPDLVVMPNVTRDISADRLPTGVPFVCWVQDAMPRLFDPPTIPPGPLDFVAGYRMPGAARVMATPPRRWVEFCVPVSERKFHRPPGRDPGATPARRVVYVSHQSEPVEALERRQLATTSPELRPAVREAQRAVERIVADWPHADQWFPFWEAEKAAAAAAGQPGDPEAAARWGATMLRPLAERRIRHQTLAWAAAAADRLGLALRLHGNGWERHPTLRAYAAGPLPHAAALRDAYHDAAASLHASSWGTHHPRVAEVALSGGLPLCRRSWGELHRDNEIAVRAYCEAHEPDVCLPNPRRDGFALGRHPRLAALLADRDRLPTPPPELCPAGWDHRGSRDAYGRRSGDPDHPEWGVLPSEAMDGVALLDDPFALTFSTAEELEERLERAAADPAWRRGHADRVAGHARRRTTASRFVERLEGMLFENLAGESAAAAP